MSSIDTSEREHHKDLVEGELIPMGEYQEYVDSVISSVQGMTGVMASTFGWHPHQEGDPANETFALFKRLFDIASYFQVARVIGHSIAEKDDTVRVSRDFICALIIATDHLMAAMGALPAIPEAPQPS